MRSHIPALEFLRRKCSGWGLEKLNPRVLNILNFFPVHATWYNNRGHILDRTQFPLLYGYAITIHKSQGELDNFGGGGGIYGF